MLSSLRKIFLPARAELPQAKQMGLMVDTNVFIKLEKGGKTIYFSEREPTEEVYISAITVSELLIGVHLEDTEQLLQRRSTFVEAVLSGVGVLDFTIGVARLHAEICAELARTGNSSGARFDHRCHCSRLLGFHRQRG